VGGPQEQLTSTPGSGTSDGVTLLAMPAETSQTLDRGLRVLAVLASHPNGLTVTELAGHVGVNRTVVYRLVTTLEQHGLARRDSAGRLHVGLGVLALARGLQPVLREVANPVLRALAEDLGATAHLTLVDGGEALAIAVVEPSWTDYHVAYRVGARHPLDQGAAGRAILLGREIAAGVEVDGHVVQTAGELQPGARGIASPVVGVDGLEASVGIVTLGDLDASTAGPRVAAAAAELARRLT
jgi:DNA-binding IclR family transcriptional regulator